MKKTDNFFLIHNFNTVPEEILEYCENYLIVDASTEADIEPRLRAQKLHYVHIDNTGHNITTYFDYFADHYEDLPEVICLCKGNMLGRHCSKEYFERVYDNKYFTYLYEDRGSRDRFSKVTAANPRTETSSISSLISESQYIEENTSWYVDSPNHPHRYFDNFDELLTFIYKDPVIPRYCLFSPGACYIVRREQIKKHSPLFYRNLNKIMNYGLNPNFPSEAHMVERMLPVIFEAAYAENQWMNDERAFDEKLSECMDIIKKKDDWNGKRFKRLRRLFGQ
ncbi:MAG: DUF3431 domain-containing protein [Clostridiales bacterium]|nr:DUF3431 domain-containing protein [Clostridiales bacterium]